MPVSAASAADSAGHSSFSSPMRRAASLRSRSGRARDEHVFEVLAGPAAGAPVDVPAEAFLEAQTRSVEDRRIEIAAVVYDDEHGRAGCERRSRVRKRARDAAPVRVERRARGSRHGGAELERTAVVETQQLVRVLMLLVVVDENRGRPRGPPAPKQVA